MKKTVLVLLFVISLINYDDLFAATLEVGPLQTYATIQAALNAAVAGDIVNVHSGTYNEIVSIMDDGITLQNNTGDSPIIQGNIKVADRNNVTITGLEITGWTGVNHGIYQYNGMGLTVSNCIIHDGSTSDGTSGIYSRNSTKVLLQNNRIYKNYTGIGIVSGHSTDNTYTNGVLIKGNEVHDNPYDGIEIHGEYITVDNNTIYNNIDTNWAANHPDGIQLIASAVDAYTTVKHAIIRNNIIRNQTQNIFTEGTLPDESSNCDDIHIYNNVLYNESATINNVDLDTLAITNINIKYSKNIYIYNNAIGRAGNFGISVKSSANGTIHIKNNIIENNLGYGIYVGDPLDIADYELNYNIYHNKKSAVQWGSTFYVTAANFAAAQKQENRGLDADPLITGWPDTKLTPTSPAIVSGVDLGLQYALDKNGRQRFDLWDIGPYESVKPSSPPNLKIK